MIIQPLPENISYFQITRLFLDPIGFSLNLEVVNPIKPTQQVKLKLCEIAYFSMSRTPEDEEGCYPIFSIQLSLWEDIALLYKKVGYKFFDVSTDGKLYYLTIEGDICLDVVSRSCLVINQDD